MWGVMFYCYRVTNLINKKVYIGITNNIRVRWNAHKSRAFNIKDSRYNYPFSNAIRKYGVDNFSFETIMSCETEQEINECEIFYIAQYQANMNRYGKLFGYNLTDGGEGVTGHKMTDETRRKMSESHKGMHPSEETLIKMSRSRTGILHTEETKQKLKEINLGKKWTEESKNKIRGEKSIKAKLTWEMVDKIREEYKSNDITQTQLAKK